MTALLQNAFTVLGLLGGGTGIAALVYLWPTVQKLRAEAGKTRVDAAVAEDAAEDAHWSALVGAQKEALMALIQPLQEEVDRLGKKVTALEEQVERITHRYRSAVGYIRLLTAWIRQHHGSHPMDLPVPPSEIASDI